MFISTGAAALSLGVKAAGDHTQRRWVAWMRPDASGHNTAPHLWACAAVRVIRHMRLEVSLCSCSQTGCCACPTRRAGTFMHTTYGTAVLCDTCLDRHGQD